MAWTFAPTTGDINHQISAKLGTGTVAASGHLNDNDIGKPMKWLADGRFGLCAAGDVPDGFLVHVNPETVDGYAFGTVQIRGRVKIKCTGAITPGALVQAAAPAAARTAEATGYGAVATHTAALTTSKRWKLIGGAGTDGSIGLVELQ